MKKYTAKECTCWRKYPNEYYNKDGHNKCLEQYKNISLTNGITRKTKCVRIEAEKGGGKMTRQQAIEHGKAQLKIFGGEHREFIKMAIVALEESPHTGIWTHSGRMRANRWVCSECGDILLGRKRKYCPECGSYNGEDTVERR